MGFGFPRLGAMEKEQKGESCHTLGKCAEERQEPPWDREARRPPWALGQENKAQRAGQLESRTAKREQRNQ